MKKTIVALCILLAIAIFVTVHTIMILRLSSDVFDISSRIEQHYQNDDWEAIQRELDALQKRWEKSRFWACMTIKTNEIEEIEISLRQSRAYAELGDKEDFIGEFIMFRMLVEHLPHQEGLSINELL